MKKTFRKLLMILLLIFVFNANAADGLDLKVSDEQNLIVEVQRIEDGAMLSLLDASGEVVYKDRFFSENSFIKVFDFNSLSNGEYKLILDREFCISTSTIVKNGESLVIQKNAYKLDFKPSYRISGDIVSICLANPEENKVEIEIFDKFGVPVGIVKTKDLVVKRKLDFSKVPEGSYKVKVKTKTNTFSKWINVG